MPATIQRYARQVAELQRGTKALKLVRANPELLDEYGDAAFDVAAEMIDSGTTMLDMPDQDAAACLKYMNDNPEFTQQHGARAFEKAAEKLKLRFHRTPLAAFQEDAEPAPQAGPIFGRAFEPDEPGGEQFDTMPGFGSDANAERVLKYQNAHPELAQKFGAGAFREAARILGVTVG